MTYTSKERAEIYLKAAEKIFDGMLDYQYACHSIADFSGLKCEASLFPEFFMFKPRRASTIDVWWMNINQKYENECRILALLLSREMAKDKTKLSGINYSCTCCTPRYC